MKLKFLILILALVSSFLYGQRLLKFSVSVDGKTGRASYINKKGLDFVSSKELAKALSGNYYYNPDAQKIELKFNNYKIKVTAKNQYIVFNSNLTGSYKVFQLPVSTLLINDDVFIPIKYFIDYVRLACEREISYDPSGKNIAVSNNTINTSSFLKSTNIKDLPVKSSNTENYVLNYEINGISIEEKSNGTLIRIKTPGRVIKPPTSISNDVLFVFLNGAKIDNGIINQVKSTGLVKKITSKVVSGNLQLEFMLKQGYSTHETFYDSDNNDLLIAVHNKLFTQPEDNTELKEKWKFDVIVIDPGHGGEDPGAIGVSGVKEKNVNLGIALKLGKLIEDNMQGVKVVYTRKSDEPVELYKRGKIANENDGKLFISIHCNSLKRKPSEVRGFEVYLLRPGRTEEAIAIAEYENSVIEYEDNPDRYQKLTDENFILVSMAHSAYMRYSEEFSDLLNQEITGNEIIPSRGIKQAGFLVLVGASMPGVLIESGFLSNRSEEAFLKSKVGQTEIAKAIFNAVKKFKEYYEKTFEDES